jgi:glycosyltransferase involved in cell wall biosynthesis
VVAIRAGGAEETVVDGETGVLVDDQTVDAFADALRHTDFGRFDPALTRRNAERFSREAFQRGLMAQIASLSAAA